MDHDGSRPGRLEFTLDMSPQSALRPQVDPTSGPFFGPQKG